MALPSTPTGMPAAPTAPCVVGESSGNDERVSTDSDDVSPSEKRRKLTDALEDVPSPDRVPSPEASSDGNGT